MDKESIHNLVAQMTLREKALLCSGLNNADTKPIERLHIPYLKMHDGPNGLRREDENAQYSVTGYVSIPAVCFPGGCALAASWDTSLMFHLGELLAEECHTETLPILLGPAINIKRTPLCGRNFEYYSEDPYLAGKMAAAYINGLQSKNIGAGLKHFAA
ncbi:MAG: glycosyl hydrolase, partial [Treponema sp.]|nr:glycosyl hydrolase [Treponema sp.]